MGELVHVLNTTGGAFVAWAGSVLIQSSMLILILAALDLILRKRIKAVVRYWIWLLVLAKLILPPSLSSPTSLVSCVGSRLPRMTLVSPTPELPLTAPEAVLAGTAARISTGQPEKVSLAAPAAGDTAPRSWGAGKPVLVSESAPMPPATIRPAVLPTWQALVLLAWMMAVLLMGGLLLQRVSFVHGLMRQSQEAPDSLRALLEQCRQQMGIRGSVGIRRSCLSASPSVCGLRRPVILVPEQMIRQLGMPQLRSVLFHELAHIHRGDLWINLLQTLLQIVYLYHPLLWWANARIRAVREQAVDETVLAALGEEAEEYPRTLLSISKLAFGRPALSLRLLGVAESEKALTKRIRHMVSRPFPRNARLGRLGLATLVVAALVLLPMARGTEKGQRGTSSLMNQVQQEEDTELSDMIRTAVENHKGASEKETLEITRRVTQSRAQILLLDTQIEEINRKIEANPGPGEAREGLLRSKKELEAKRMTEMANLREVMGVIPKPAFGYLGTATLNAWVTLNVLEERVVVLDTFKPFFEHWYQLRHKVVGALSQKETLDYLQGRFNGKKSLPIRIQIYYLPEMKRAAEGLRQKIFALAREAHAERDADIRLELSVWVGSGESLFYLRGGKIRTFYPQPALRPDGGPAPITSGLVDPNDLEQHILWRLTMPKNLPLTFRIEYDEASSQLAKQVANTAKAIAKREGLTDLVNVAGVLVEPVPEKAFLGKWQALANGIIRGVDIQPGGACQVTVGEGSSVLKAGTSVRGTWVWTVKEILLDINDPVMGRKGYPPYIYRATVSEEGNLVIERGEIWPQGSFMKQGLAPMILKRVAQQSEPVRTELESKPATQRANVPEPAQVVPRVPFDKLPTANLNAWVKLQVLEQKVVVFDTQKGFSDNWPQARHKVVGVFSEKETLDYLQGRFKDPKSLPIRIHLFYLPETRRAMEDLRQKICTLGREANAAMDTDVRLEQSTWVGSGESPFYLREGKIRTFYPGTRPRPDGGPRPLASGLVDPNDLEQHILWRLTMPKNVPLTFRIEYDEASSQLAKQVANTAKVLAKREGLTDLVGVAGTLVEPVPESAFLGKWQALGKGVIQNIEIQPGGACQAIVGEGISSLKAGTIVTGTWVWTVREIQFDINDPMPWTRGVLHFAYRATVNGEGSLVIQRGEIYPQGSFMHTRPPEMVFRKVQ